MVLPEILLQIDPLSRVFVMAFALVGVPCLLYMLSLQKDVRLAAVSVSFIAAAMGVVLARDFLWFLIFWELTVLLACCLIVYERKPSSFAVMYRYFLIQLVAGTSLFFAIAVQYAANGSFEMSAVVPEAKPFFLVAFLTKAAVVPVHVWVPLTYPSVPPAIAVILCAYSTKIGVYAFARLMPGIPWLAYAGALMALFGVAMALRQKTARHFLSYQHVGQVGYILTGIAMGTELGMSGATFHMISHMVYMSLLFMAAGAVLHRRGTEMMVGAGGLRKTMPLTFAAAVVGAAATSGLPPLNGYVSKTLLKAAAEGHGALQGMLLLAGIGTAFSFSKFIWYLFLNENPSDPRENENIKEMPGGACIAMGMLALLCCAQGVFYPQWAAMIVGANPYAVFGGKQVILGAAPVLLGIALYGLARFGARLFACPTAGRRTASANREASEGMPPWDVEVVYAWLLGRLVAITQAIARRAKDETQAYILVIVALLVALVAFLAR